MSTFTLDYSRWIDDEPKPLASGLLTVAVHVGFVALLLLNMEWQHKIQPQASVKLWESMPTTANKAVAKPEPRQTRKKATKKPEVKPAQKVEPTPVESPQPPTPPQPAVQPGPEPAFRVAPEAPALRTEPAPTPTVEATAPAPEPVAPPPRADLAAPERERTIERSLAPTPAPAIEQPSPSPSPAAFEQQAAPRPEIDVEELKRERALALAELLREEESARLDDTLDKERQARIAEQKKQLEERDRKLAQELEAIRAAAQQRQDAQNAKAESEAAAQQLSDDYRARISAKIRQRVILPPDLRGNPEANYEVSLLPDGSVTQVRLLQSSGFATYDAAVERAILAAQPLPVPKEPRLFQANFRNLFLSFRPKE